jgi:L-alanine-DL-glutamate epimerase-like enolase superfamily enzyme
MVKISSIQVFEYELQYTHGDYVMSHGRSSNKQTSLVVHVQTDEGVEGWGETCPHGGTYGPAFLGGERAAIVLLAEEVIGLDPRNLGALNRVMDDLLLGGASAKSAIDVACWDILGKSAGLPIVELLGGRMQEAIRILVPVPIGSPGSMAEFVAREGALGFNLFQIKVGDAPMEDVARVRAVLEVVEPETLVIIDANGGWNLQSALIAVKELNNSPIFLEQPCKTMVDCAELRRHTGLPMVLDECINSLTDLMIAKFSVGADGVNIKPGRVGGLSKAKVLRDAAQGLGMSVTVDETWGGSLATSHIAHLAASTEADRLLAATFFADFTEPHITSGPFSVDGFGKAPTGHGLGIEVNDAMLGNPVFELNG